jgi:ketosteroid isomerase-like protein
MNPRAEIEEVFRQLVRAHADRDADGIVAAYADDAVIYDLAPPLRRRGIKRDDVSTWLASWDGGVLIESQAVDLVTEGNLAFASALNRMRGRQGGKEQDLWYRATTCLRRVDARWQIVHEHTSVPFYMDGSYRAAIDLKP